MASPAEIARILPETLPEDFSEWDGESSSAALPPDHDDSEDANGFAADSNPFAQFPQQQIHEPLITAAPRVDEFLTEPSPLSPAAYSDRDALGERMKAINAALKSKSVPVSQAPAAACATAEDSCAPIRTSRAEVDARRNTPSLPPAASTDEEAFYNQLRTIGSLLDAHETKPSRKPADTRATDEVSSKPVPSHGGLHRRWPVKPIHVTATIGMDDPTHTPMFQSDLADLGDRDQNRKRWMNVAAIGGSFLTSVVLGVWLLSSGRPAPVKQSLEPQPAAVVATPVTHTRKRSPSTHLTKTQATMNGRPGSKAEDYLLPQVDSQQVSDQPTATAKAPQSN
ncbi:MAG: hypothetical protein WBE76_00155 [Terracidiphilus sp.]